MTVITSERYIGGGALMSIQRKSNYIMWEESGIHDREFGIGSAMFGMAVTAGEIWIIVLHLAMH